MGEIAITKECPVCGKQFVILYPHLWAYKRGAGKNGSTRYFCSWKCLRELDNEGERKRGNVRICTDENEREAVKIFLEGGDHFGYLKGLGIKNPAMKWYDIRSKLKETDPELYQKTGRKPKTVETPEGSVKAPAVPKGAETPETPKAPVPRITKPVVYDGMTVREVEGDYGRYRRSDVNGTTYIDFEYTERLDVISLPVESWKDFVLELSGAAKILGVEL